MAKKPKLTQAYRKRRQFAASAVRSYNAAVTRIEKQFGKSNAPPRRSVDELKKNFPKMKALKNIFFGFLSNISLLIYIDPFNNSTSQTIYFLCITVIFSNHSCGIQTPLTRLTKQDNCFSIEFI